MDSENFSCYQHMKLVEKFGFRDLVRFLFADIEKTVHHNVKRDKYSRKGWIFSSLVIQFVLQCVARLLGQGTRKEKGKRVEKESEEHYTILGRLDRRVELAKEIRHGDARYFPHLCMMASKLAYENKAIIRSIVSRHWKMKFMEFYNFYNEFQEEYTTQGFMFRDENKVIVAFRGTQPFNAADWITDFDISWCKIHRLGKVHRGFMIALGLTKLDDPNHPDGHLGGWPKQLDHHHCHRLAYYTLRERFRTIMEADPGTEFIVTGHSLGGALAVLFPAILALHGETAILKRIKYVYTYGQPRVGDEKFRKFMKNNLKENQIEYKRIVYGNDIVPRIPFDDSTLMYKHFGTCIHFNSLYQGKVIKEELERKPQTVLGWIGDVLMRKAEKTLNAIWEVARGFILPYTVGPDYREGWLLICTRIFGILAPSIVAHGPQDYVNCTRLGSPHLFLSKPKLSQPARL